MNTKEHKLKKLFVSVVVATRNRDTCLIELLKSLFLQKYSDFEVIVVDQSDKSFPAKDNYYQKIKTKITIVRSQSKGAGRARNIGIKKAKGQIIVFLDDDVVADKDLIKSHVEAYGNKSIGAVCGRVITRGQKIEADNQQTGRIKWWGEFTDGFSSSVSQEVTTAITCNSSWRCDVLGRIGGFDEKLDLIREDSDLSLRTIAEGYKIAFIPKALAYHHRAESGGYRKTEGRLDWYRGFFRCETYFFLKHWPHYLVPLVLLLRSKWAMKCMFGFGREVSFRSMVTPFLGVYDGFLLYRGRR